MTCRHCSDRVGDLFHDMCRSHAECAKGIQYYARPCSVCQELWRRARDLDHPEDAIVAFKVLKEWIHGFRKNSRHRSSGSDYFFCDRERDLFRELSILNANLEDISASDRDSIPAAQPRVSILLSY